MDSFILLEVCTLVKPDIFKVYAIKYATKDGKRSDNFYGNIFGKDPQGEYSMPMDYNIFAAVSDNHTVIVDGGFTAEVAKKRNRTYLRSPIETLNSLGIDTATVPLVVLTHLHYDHTGNLDCFPNATFVIQESEMSFWTGRYASRGLFRSFIEENDIIYLVQKNLRGHVRFVNGMEEIVPGITVCHAGGHSEGLQVLKINTENGNVVLASDVSHYYENINEDRPFHVISDLPGMYRAFDIVRSLADESSIIVPGHDPKIMELFPTAKEGLEGLAVRLDTGFAFSEYSQSTYSSNYS